MGRGQRRATLLRLALVLMAPEANNMTRGVSDSGDFVYECPEGHIQRLPWFYERPPKCDRKGCRKRTKFVPKPDKP
jgi:hypothetical protein